MDPGGLEPHISAVRKRCLPIGRWTRTGCGTGIRTPRRPESKPGVMPLDDPTSARKAGSSHAQVDSNHRWRIWNPLSYRLNDTRRTSNFGSARGLLRRRLHCSSCQPENHHAIPISSASSSAAEAPKTYPHFTPRYVDDFHGFSALRRVRARRIERRSAPWASFRALRASPWRVRWDLNPRSLP